MRELSRRASLLLPSLQGVERYSDKDLHFLVALLMLRPEVQLLWTQGARPLAYWFFWTCETGEGWRASAEQLDCAEQTESTSWLRTRRNPLLRKLEGSHLRKVVQIDISHNDTPVRAHPARRHRRHQGGPGERAVTELGGTVDEDDLDRATHVVVECAGGVAATRTLKYVRALAAGKWIIRGRGQPCCICLAAGGRAAAAPRRPQRLAARRVGAAARASQRTRSRTWSRAAAASCCSTRAGSITSAPWCSPTAPRRPPRTRSGFASRTSSARPRCAR
jgi:hypothetical protein